MRALAAALCREIEKLEALRETKNPAALKLRPEIGVLRAHTGLPILSNGIR